MIRFNLTKLFVAGMSLCMLYSTPSIAQDEGNNLAALEEIVVTGRKREETLQEVPISISVLGENLISDAGIVNQYDLFEMVPGVHYDEVFDRNAAHPSIRGVQSNEVATNRTKVTAFIDGMPIIGSQGSIGFHNVQQIEIYRGPQSAAFGRSTFGGAVNYVTRDPGDTFDGSVNANFNSYGTRIVSGSVSGPLSDTLGYMIDAQIEDSTSPDDYIATDGIHYGEQSGEHISAKFVFTPTDAFEAELTFSSVSLDDTPTIDYLLSEASRDNCAGSLGTDSIITMGMGGGVYNIGIVDCDWAQGSQWRAQNDRELFLRNNVNGMNDLATFAAAARAAGASDATSVTGSVEEDILMVAAGYSIPAEHVGGQTERDRITLQADYLLESGHALQASIMTSDEQYIRHYDGSRNYTTSLPIVYMGGFYSAITMGSGIGTIMSDPSDISENYVDVRWVSPGEDRLRYVVGASLYEYHFETLKYFDNGYGAILEGFVPEFEQLTGINQLEDVSAIIEDANNTGLFFNVAYDLTDRLTATLEGRYQSDDVSGVDPNSGRSGGIKTTGFIPRLSFNYNVDDNTSYYLQIAKGVNPGGVNTDYFDDRPGGFGDTLANGIPDGLGNNPDYTTDAACTGDEASRANTACNSRYVDYDADAFSTFKEEELTNIEFGFKGNALDGRLQYAGAIYTMAWTGQVQPVNLSWNNPDAAGGGQMAGDPIPGGGFYGPNYVASVTNFADSRTFASIGDLTMQGFELESTYLLGDNWNIRATLSWQDAVFGDDYCDVASLGTGRDTYTGATVLTQEADGVLASCVLVAGNSVNRQPDFQFALSPSYSTGLANGSRLSARADLRYESDQYRDVLNVGQTPAVATVNLSVGLSTDTWNTTLYVSNLFDEDTPRQFGSATDTGIVGSTSVFGNSNYQIQPRQPQSIGLRLGYNF